MANSDTFKPDDKAFQAAAAHMKTMYDSSAKVEARLKSVAQVMTLLSKTQQSMSKATIVDPRAAKYAEALKQSLEGAGVATEKLTNLGGKTVLTYQQLSLLDKARLFMMNHQLEAQNRMVLSEGKLVQLETLKSKTLVAANKAVVGTAKSVVNMVTSTAGLELSFMGILLLLMKIKDAQNRIGAMSQQMAAQWGESTTAIGTAQTAMGKLRGLFGMSVDEAGAIGTSLARAGVEEKETVATAVELVAIQEKYGLSVEESLGYVAELNRSYGMTTAEASKLLRAEREVTKTIPYLSMSEVSSDMMELVKDTRSYNTDLLGTLSLYNTLINKDVAQHMGLGDAPMQVRKDIVKTVAGFNQQLGEGWKAALGDGATAAARILNFEKLLPEEQFTRIGKLIQEQLQGTEGAEEKEFKARKLLESMGFSAPEMTKWLGKAFAGGDFNTDAFAKEMTTQREKMKSAEEQAGKQRERLITSSSNIAKGLMSFEEKFKRSIEDNMFKSGNAETLLAAITEMENWLINEAPQKLVELIGVLDKIAAIIETVYEKLFPEAAKAAKLSPAQRGAGMSEGYFENVGQKAFAGMDSKAIQEGLADMDEAFGSLKDEMKETAYANMKQNPVLGAMTLPQVNKAMGNIALSGISSKESFGNTDEMTAFVTALRSHDVDTLKKLFLQQLRDKTLVEKQLGKFNGYWQSHTNTTQAVAALGGSP